MPSEQDKQANEYALTVKWRGDDYGMRKQYYTDAYLAGHAAAQKEFEESLRVAIKALSGVADTSPEVEAASMEVLNDTNECSEIWEANARRRRKIAIEALAHLAKAGHYLGEEK